MLRLASVQGKNPSHKSLPLILASRLVEEVLLAVDSEHTVLQCALPKRDRQRGVVTRLGGKGGLASLPLVLNTLHLIVHAKHDVTEALLVDFGVFPVVISIV
jgi:hypothetical protein